ncbi:MAG: ABC-F family ATP-binding cassette domain-containing protein [Dysgonomonas sp.]|nr:ABC-F family ATP-binding cassette domain-containing protein [Dysgonomonas sp.]
MSIIIKKLSYTHFDRELLFQDISFSINKGQKISLIGNNGVGKSTLLKIVAGQLQPSDGEVIISDKPYYVPQHFGQYDNLTVAQALGIDRKLEALSAILDGDASTENFNILDDDWTIEERAITALAAWNLQHISLHQSFDTLSGGEKTKVFLSGIDIHSPSIILFDEPSNHLDITARNQLYDLIQNGKSTMIIVSHDRTLLNLMTSTYELSSNNVDIYGGNYEFYKIQKEEKLKALEAQFDEKEKALRQAKQIAREAAERKQKQDAGGKKKQEKAGVARIMMGKLKDTAEQSSSRLKEVHSSKMDNINNELKQIKDKLPDLKELKLNFENTNLHTGKILIDANQVNFGYTEQHLWSTPLTFQIRSGDRIAIKGNNGSGKTTLLKLILGQLMPTEGKLARADFEYLYIDQEYSLINDRLTVYEQVQQFNSRHFLEHELKTLLHRFLFTVDMWDKTCDKLSGGEKMKLVFCCLSVSNNAPDMFILDEPTNNLDIQSLDIIAATIKDYKGTVLVISHDEYFIKEIGAEREINLNC